MSEQFELYLQELAKKEQHKIDQSFGNDSRGKLTMLSGQQLNWIGDFVSNPEAKWEFRAVSIDQILFTGTTPGQDKILIDQCERSPRKLLELIEKDHSIREELEKTAHVLELPIMLRMYDDGSGKFGCLDGMHRFVGRVLQGDQEVEAWVCTKEVKPFCEPHLVYDLIRGYQRLDEKSEQSTTELQFALQLLMKSYANVKKLLVERFDPSRLRDEDVQNIISKAIKAV